MAWRRIGVKPLSESMLIRFIDAYMHVLSNGRHTVLIWLDQIDSISNTESWWRHQLEYFPRYWPFVRGIHRSPVNSPHKDQWRVALMFSLICAWINSWVNNREAGDLGRHSVHYDVTVMENPQTYFDWKMKSRRMISLFHRSLRA